MEDSVTGRPKPAGHLPACPVCGKPALPEHRPFCSVRCGEVDLQRWLVGTYAVPAEEGEEQPSDEPGG